MGSWTEGALRSVAGHALQMRRWNRSRASVQRIRRPAARLAHEVGPLGVFVDFGADFMISDIDGEQPLSAMLSGITQASRLTAIEIATATDSLASKITVSTCPSQK